MFEESVAPHKYVLVKVSVCVSNVNCFRATILQHELSKVGKLNTESLAKPAVMRAGSDGKYLKFLIFRFLFYFLFVSLVR